MTAEEFDVRGAVTIRFDLSIQKSRLMVYVASFVTGVVGQALGVFTVNWPFALTFWLGSMLATLVFMVLLRTGTDRRVVNALWMSADVIATTAGVYATGGIDSPWFIWFAVASSGAAFATGRRAGYLISLACSTAYVVLLLAMGQATLFNAVFYTAIVRMAFLLGASYFFLTGIGNLQDKRRQVRILRLEESRKVVELTRLTDELNRRTQELGEANRRILESDRLKSQFLANMSHELRTPMNSIIGFSEILVERLQDRVEVKHLNFLKHILVSGQHLLGIINDILDLSKIEAGRMEVFPERFRLAPVIENVCHLMRGMARTSHQFVLDVPDDLPPIETDLAKFKQVLFNLLSNAVKFSPSDSIVTIRASQTKDASGADALRVSVTDRGIGIDRKDHELIFEEFRQIDGTVKREFGGTGLGLALVRKFVELQAGHVELESTPGLGSTFSFTLPVHSKAAVINRQIAIEGTANGQSERVLVVEDDPKAYDLIAAALTSAGYVPLRARHGEEALTLARDTQPLAITLDLVLPGLDGWEVLKRLKADPATCDIPVVIISMVDNRELGAALGADDYFVKPVDRELLIGRLRRLTEGDARIRILLIDDEVNVHELIAEELSGLDFTIESAYTGETGIRAARENVPDVIILDLMMPGMSGFEVANQLQEDVRTAGVPIVVLTSKEIAAEDRRELQAKVASFVQKGNGARDQLVREIRRLEHSQRARTGSGASAS